MKRYRVLIVDDEPIARRGIRRELERQPDIDIVGECGNGRDAVAAISSLSPDLVILDQQMPEMSGFDVVAAVGAHQMPAVIFVTAYDKYALQAFEVNALDYILKPFTSDRFNKALERARMHIERVSLDGLRERLMALLQAEPSTAPPAAEQNYLDRIMIKSSGRIFFLNVSEIDWIEAAENYLSLHVGSQSHLVRETMNGMESKLDPCLFVRIRRSTMVNRERVLELQPLSNGEYTIVLKGGTRLTSSRRFRKNLDRLMKH